MLYAALSFKAGRLGRDQPPFESVRRIKVTMGWRLEVPLSIVRIWLGMV
jgi:hypothetical protein